MRAAAKAKEEAAKAEVVARGAGAKAKEKGSSYVLPSLSAQLVYRKLPPYHLQAADVLPNTQAVNCSNLNCSRRLSHCHAVLRVIGRFRLALIRPARQPSAGLRTPRPPNSIRTMTRMALRSSEVRPASCV